MTDASQMSAIGEARWLLQVIADGRNEDETLALIQWFIDLTDEHGITDNDLLEGLTDLAEVEAFCADANKTLQDFLKNHRHGSAGIMERVGLLRQFYDLIDKANLPPAYFGVTKSELETHLDEIKKTK